MSTLDGQARSVVEEGREGYEPSAQDETRVLARVEASIAAGVTVSLESDADTTGATTAAGSTTGKTAMGTGTKFAFAALALAVLGITLYMLKIDEAPTAGRLSMQATQTRVDAPAQVLPIAREPAPAALANVATDGSTSTPAITAEESPAPVHTDRAPIGRVAPVLNYIETSDVAAEAALLRQAQRDLNSGHASEALASLDAFRSRFVHATLREEESAARVLTLCALGRTADATHEARIFARRFANSPLLARVNGSCVAQP